MAVTSGSGNSPRAVKLSPIAVPPTSPRHRWPMGLAVFNPSRRSWRSQSQTRITGMAKNERKNTASPVGTWIETVLMQVTIAMKTTTEAIFRAMPRVGFTAFSVLASPQEMARANL